MINLSQDTQKLLEKLFPEEERLEMSQRLVEECSENIPFCENLSPEDMERIRFSIMKLCKEKNNTWDTWFELAKIDWRDLFVAAGFGYDPKEHVKWRNEVLSNRWK